MPAVLHFLSCCHLSSFLTNGPISQPEWLMTALGSLD
jgi:hypothetical protein